MNRREFVALSVVCVGGHALAHAPENAESDWQLRVEEVFNTAWPDVTLSLPTVKVIRRGAAKGRVGVDVRNSTGTALRVRSASWSRDLLLGPGMQERCTMDGGANAIVHVSAGGAVTRSLLGDCGAAIGNADISYVLPIEHWGPAAGSPRYLTLGGALDPSAKPLHVRSGQRMHLRLFNGTGTRALSLALPEHRFQVHAIDGEELKHPCDIPHLSLGPAQFIDVVVPMIRPGRWMLGSLSRSDQDKGFGRLVEYVGSHDRIAGPVPVRARTQAGSIDPMPDVKFQKTPTRELVYCSAATDTLLSVRPGMRHRLIFSNLYGGYQTLAVRAQRVEVRQQDANPVRGIERSILSLPPYSKTVVEFTPQLAHAEIMAL